MKEKKEIKVKVTYSEGYEQRFTAALLKQIARREREQRPQEQKYPA